MHRRNNSLSKCPFCACLREAVCVQVCVFSGIETCRDSYSSCAHIFCYGQPIMIQFRRHKICSHTLFDVVECPKTFARNVVCVDVHVCNARMHAVHAFVSMYACYLVECMHMCMFMCML